MTGTNGGTVTGARRGRTPRTGVPPGVLRLTSAL
jgi:hypothetical protein